MTGDTYARCNICGIDIAHGGRNDVTKHVSVKHHIEMTRASSSSKSVSSFFLPKVTQSVMEAETRWALFVAKHNLAFLTSDHSSRFLKTMKLPRNFLVLAQSV